MVALLSASALHDVCNVAAAASSGSRFSYAVCMTGQMCQGCLHYFTLCLCASRVWAMVSLRGLPVEYCELLQRHCPYVLLHDYLHPNSRHRHLDFFEMYSGAARLSHAVQKVGGCEKNIISSFLLI